MQATSVSIGTLSENIRETSRFNGMVLGCFGCWFLSKVPETWWFQPQIGALRCLRTKLWPWGDIRQLWMVAWRLAPRGRCYAENHPGLRFTRNYTQLLWIHIYILFDDFDVNIVLHGSFFSSQNIATKRHICPCKAVSYEPLLGMLGHLQAALWFCMQS